MLVYRILLGLLGLGIVVFVHELGHFIAARLMKIDVEAFSIGWGKPILKKKIGAVEYRLGIFPMGGYCKMRGDGDYEEVYEKSKKGIPAEKGTFFSANPFRRIVACIGGPLFNLVFAVLILSVIWGIGFEVTALSNRVILVSEIFPGNLNPADEAGLRTGDRIIEVSGRRTETSRDLQRIIAVNPRTELTVRIERNGELLDLSVTPAMDSSGIGRIGVYFWTDPVIERIVEDSPAEIAGLKTGDKILRVNGSDLPHSMALLQILADRPQLLNIEFSREGQNSFASLIPIYNETGALNLGIVWESLRYRTPRLSPPMAVARGVSETWETFIRSIGGLALLFQGVDLTQAVAGPVRITYMVGDIAVDGFREDFWTGISSMASFLALISIALCIMNLLPLPILDGGMILLYLAEGIRRKLLHPKFISVFQAVGVVLIGGLMVFALFGDILFFTNR
jgi:regulator of sigma E protease